MGNPRERCPCCNTILDGSGFRRGVRLPPTQLRIFDAVEGAGSIGLSTEQLTERLGLKSPNLKAQIWHLNENLAMAGLRVRSGSQQHHYRLREV